MHSPAAYFGLFPTIPTVSPFIRAKPTIKFLAKSGITSKKSLSSIICKWSKDTVKKTFYQWAVTCYLKDNISHVVGRCTFKWNDSVQAVHQSVPGVIALTYGSGFFIGKWQKIIESSQLQQHIYIVLVCSVCDTWHARVCLCPAKLFLGDVFICDCLYIFENNF